MLTRPGVDNRLPNEESRSWGVLKLVSEEFLHFEVTFGFLAYPVNIISRVEAVELLFKKFN